MPCSPLYQQPTATPSDVTVTSQVSAVPVVFAVKDGSVADKFIGLQDLDRITSFIRSLIDK